MTSFLKGATGRLALAAVAGMAALTLAPQAAEAGTVVASSGPSARTYPVGAQIGNTQRITLREGDSLTVLDGGRTRVLRGPGTYVLAQGSAGTENRGLAALTSRRTDSRARTGAVRTGDTGLPPSNPNLWYVDVAAAGTVCLATTDRLNLWRGDADAAASYTIAPADAPEDTVRVTFLANEMLARWDSALQVRDGGSYVITNEAEGATSVQVTLTLLAEVPADDEALAQALIANGCMLQLQQIVTAAETAS